MGNVRPSRLSSLQLGNVYLVVLGLVTYMTKEPIKYWYPLHCTCIIPGFLSTLMLIEASHWSFSTCRPHFFRPSAYLCPFCRQVRYHLCVNSLLVVHHTYPKNPQYPVTPKRLQLDFPGVNHRADLPRHGAGVWCWDTWDKSPPKNRFRNIWKTW